ncbi:type I secretion system permease/ATPase [Rubellimicrobium aerolatum]|uniref:Type I secretion system permease/ATPase n=1 Tax=Rubellimicrobium aerolatum TaxID=490979 RepID=A0ABW0S9E2_9RHOB|nr:type I secretion system permease/ATPase [Rubellimicrobium aerolatum]MBP1804920.1 PrtD family type I secretion system ABC transporter [Rubellimicrobium aerolatum]
MSMTIAGPGPLGPIPSARPAPRVTGPEAEPRAVFNRAIRALRRAFAVIFGFSIVINVLMLTGSIYMLQVYDRVLSSRSVDTLLALFGIVVVLYAFLGFFDFLRARMLGLAAVRLDQALGAGSFAHVLRGGLPSTRGAAEAAPQPLANLETLRGFLSGGAVTALFDAPLVPLYLGVLFLVHPVLGWLTVGGAAVTAVLALANHLVTSKSIGQTLSREAAERELVERSRRGAEAIAGMRMQEAVVARWQAFRNAALAAGQTSGHPAEILAATSRAFRMLLQSAILSAGAWLVIQGDISGGMIIASSILSGRALAPVDQIIGGWRAIRRAALARRALEKVFAEAPSSPGIVHLPEPEGRLEVRALTKAAPQVPGQGERRPLLDGVTFALEPGDGLAIVGASGSGKSTLVRALLGIVAPDAGEVRLDGATLDQWEPGRLGRHVGYLPQMPDLLPGSARDVIARFDPAITDKTVIEAAWMVGIHDMLLALPHGYATEVGGAAGAALSGGQMQRLGLARAICGMPRLVILDEPNAHLDAAGDEALARVILRLRQAGSTVIVVTHRPAALAALNRILVLRDGQVERFGPLAEGQATDPHLPPLTVVRPAAVARDAAPEPLDATVIPVPGTLADDAAARTAPADPALPDESALSVPPGVAQAMRRLAEQRAAHRARMAARTSTSTSKARLS